MKIFGKLIVLIIITMLIFSLIIKTQVCTFASQSLNINTRNIVNIAVLLYSLDDPYSLLLKQDLENIQKENENKVLFTFVDGKNNISIQNQALDSLLKSNVDLFLIGSVDVKESTVADIINKVKEKNVPLILIGIDPQVAASVSKYYDKITFAGLDIKEAACCTR
jgi:methyl-galactoside transport system substrate-binding protein